MIQKTLKEARYDWGWRLKQLGITKAAFCERAGLYYDSVWYEENPKFFTLLKIQEELQRLENEVRG
jgi:hypothetical protein